MDGEPGVEVDREPDRRAGATLHTLAQGERSSSTDTSKGLPMIQWLPGKPTAVRKIWGQTKKSSQQDKIKISKVQGQAQAYSQ